MSNVNKIMRKNPNNKIRVYCSFEDFLISLIILKINNNTVIKVRKINKNNINSN